MIESKKTVNEQVSFTDIDVIILCGGKGTRIRDVVDDLPKPMIQIGDKPLVEHIINHYTKFSRFESSLIILATGYKGKVIEDYFLGNDDVLCKDTGIETNTGGRFIKIVTDLYEMYKQRSFHVALTYGDGVTDLDLNKLVEYHLSHDKYVTLTVVHPPGRFGEVQFHQMGVNGTKDDKIPLGLITSFAEKPSQDKWINGGFMLFRVDKAFIDWLHLKFWHVDEIESASLERDILPILVDRGEVMAYPHTGYWQHMDTLHEFNKLQKDYIDGMF